MKLIDANLLLYAVNRDAPHHERVRPWLEGRLSGSETIALSWTVLLAFLRLSTRPIAFSSPLSLSEAFSVVESWLSRPCVVVVHPTDRHVAVLRDLLETSGTAGNSTSDAHLAALAIEHGAEVCSSDSDFGRFPGLRWHNPLL